MGRETCSFILQNIGHEPQTPTCLSEADKEEEVEDSYVINLLRFTGSFGFVYCAFAFLAGSDHATSGGRVSLGPWGAVHEGLVSIVMGILGLVEIAAIITFLAELKRKVIYSA